MDHDRYSDDYVRDILHSVSTVAVVGASANAVRPSYFVVKYLLAKGYRVFPINPGQAGGTILDQPVFRSLSDIPEPIDMVDIFRRSDAVPTIVAEAIALQPRPKVIWMQLGIRNDDAAAEAEEAGMQVVMDRCPKIEYARLSGEISWSGVNSRQISARRPLRQQGVQHLGLHKSKP
ncbi:CoA-binding protein [Amorphus orientalis]|uniref:CoA-binding protein n=1 Tax=Amorphus orientalis TaxID=649198 RepID=A0AAE3VQ37_9HYPH|nr:CoA-binding protein [Amorphus orientalis]MDQ0316027.1 putative CoA-binding protein [Amorphus orientalis]